ncbi:transporter substrate-binding domain-containing protein [Silvanigrella aquatica]|uniref:Uncharacterized protein n=1 Tax=Silvanigrella aquatica TaxID=1915309 RepID=A0A1L4CYA6_9BACT|nr:transporter substrate-binding domain-containing protein [Silvanigrella aquatica]APJ02915.1 hypothetical protein AXG55_02865 [Silvanigrella aquatica]
MSSHFTKLDFMKWQNFRAYMSKLIIFGCIALILPNNSYAKKNNITLLTPPSPSKFHFEIAHEIFKLSELNAKIHIELYPNIYKKMDSCGENPNNIFATIAVLNENNTRKYYNILNILTIETSFYSLKSSKKKSTNIDEVKNLDHVCVWLDSVLNKYLINQGFENLYPVPTLNQCTKMLFENKVDALYASESSLMKSTKALGLDALMLKKGYAPMQVTFYLAITKNAPKDIIQRLNNSAEILKSSGRYDEILEKYKKELFLPE